VQLLVNTMNVMICTVQVSQNASTLLTKFNYMYQLLQITQTTVLHSCFPDYKKFLKGYKNIILYMINNALTCL